MNDFYKYIEPPSATSDEYHDFRPICLDVLKTPYSFHPNTQNTRTIANITILVSYILMSLFGFILFFIAIWFCWKQWLMFRSKGKIERTINFYIRSYEIPFKRQEIDLSRDEVKQLMNRLFMNFQQNKVGKIIGKGQYGEVYEYKTGKTKIDVIKKPKCCPSKKIMECDAGEKLLIMVYTSNLSAMKILFFLA